MRPSMPREKNPSGYGTRSTSQLPSGCSASSESELVPLANGTFVAEAERVEAVDEVVVLEVDGHVAAHALEPRARHRMQRPAFAAVLAVGRRRPLQRTFALAAVEAGEVAAARQRRPDHAVRIDVDAARRVADDAGRRIERRLVRLANAGLRIDADDLARHRARAPRPTRCRRSDAG